MRRRSPGWWLVALVSAIPVALWLLTNSLSDRFVSRSIALSSFAVLVGLVAYSLFACNVVLGSRVRPIERLFLSLDRVYKAHRRLGAVVVIVVLTHAALMVASRGAQGLDAMVDLLAPDPGWRIFAGVLTAAAITVLVFLSFYAPLRHRGFVFVQRLSGLVFVLTPLHVLRVPAASTLSTPLRAYLIALGLAAGVAYVRRSILTRLLVRRYRYRLVEVHPHHPRVVELVAAPDKGRRLEFQPGQFAFLSLDHPFVDKGPHPFSITSGRGDPNLRFVVKAVGDHTSALLTAKPGVLARVEGPFGGLSHERMPSKRQIWVAGGIGITPFLSMARSLGEGYEVDLYYATAHLAEAHFLGELRQIAKKNPSFRVIPVTEDDVGFVTADYVRQMSGSLKGRDILICGPPAMLDNLRYQFRHAGVPDERIHAEDFRFH